jgi:hypothetical protein
MHPISDSKDQVDLETIQGADPIITFWKQQVDPSKDALEADTDLMHFNNLSKLCIRYIFWRKVKT